MNMYQCASIGRYGGYRSKVEECLSSLSVEGSKGGEIFFNPNTAHYQPVSNSAHIQIQPISKSQKPMLCLADPAIHKVERLVISS